MCLFNFLNENIINKVESKITEEEFYKILKSKCSKNFEQMLHNSEKLIYRGIKTKDEFLKFDGSIKRTSAHTSNHYTILFSELLSSWRDIPKRDHSLICTSSSEKAEHYGNTYLVIPFDDTKIAACGADDFWNSIYWSPEFLQIGIMSLNNFNIFLTKLDIKDTYADMRKFLSSNILDLYFKDINSLEISQYRKLIYLAFLYINIKLDRPEMNSNTPKLQNEIEKNKDKLKNIKIYDIFNKFLDPKNMSVNITKLSNLEEYVEVWMDKPALLIKVNINNINGELLKIKEKL